MINMYMHTDTYICIYREMRKRAGYATHTGYICRCIEETIAFGALLIRSRTRRKKVRRVHIGSAHPYMHTIPSESTTAKRMSKGANTASSNNVYTDKPSSSSTTAAAAASTSSSPQSSPPPPALKSFDQLIFETSSIHRQTHIKSKCDVTSNQVKWLAYTAFYTIFSTKKRFPGVEKWLYRCIHEYECHLQGCSGRMDKGGSIQGCGIQGTGKGGQGGCLGQLKGWIDNAMVRYMLQTGVY